jgi:hypothetical protein
LSSERFVQVQLELSSVWVDPRVDLDDMEELKFLTLPGSELRYLGRPVRSQSLYLYKQTNSVVLVRERTMPIERPPLVGEVIASFCG